MRVFLLGGTGNLGSRVIPALLAHRHSVVVYVRSVSKLRSLVSTSIIDQITIVSGDATDSAGVKQAILDNNCDAIVDTAGNQVFPWHEHLLPKIAKAVSDAAVAVGEERGKPMRAWFIGGLGLLEYPGTKYNLQDYLPKVAVEQHQGTLGVLEAVPLKSLRWSLLCVAIMKPAIPTIEPLAAPRTHKLLIQAKTPPNWKDHMVRSIPLVGVYLNLLVEVVAYTTELEDVADFLAEDLEDESQAWVGKQVGMKQKEKGT